MLSIARLAYWLNRIQVNIFSVSFFFFFSLRRRLVALAETGIHYVAVVDATFDSGRPHPDQIRRRSYGLEMWWTRCLEWGSYYDDEGGKMGGLGGIHADYDGGGDGGGAPGDRWTKGTCETLNSSSIHTAHCRYMQIFCFSV